jgi:hypothetical protein
MKTSHFTKLVAIVALLATLLLGGAGDVVALGPGTTLLAAIDASSISPTADPHVFALRDARGRAGRIGTLTGDDDLVILGQTTNYMTDGGTMRDVGGDGLADRWYYSEDCAGTPTLTVLPYGDGWLQDVAYTAVSTDSGKLISFYIDVYGFSEGNSATFSFDVLGNMTGASVYAWIYARSGSSALGNVSAVLSPNASPQRVSLTYSSLPAGTTYIRTLVQVRQIDNGDVVSLAFGKVNIEKAAYSSRYCGPSTGCFWNGTPYNSSSTRTAESLFVDTGITGTRAIELWWTPDTGSSAGEMFVLASNVSDSPVLMVAGDDFSLDIVPNSVQFSYPFNAGEPLHIVARWDNGLSLAVNGEIHTSGSGDYGDVLSTVYLGLDHYGVAQCNGELSAIRFYNTVSDDDVATLYNSGAGLSVDEVADIREFVQGEEGAFMVDPTVTYGDGGTIVAVMSVASALLLIVAIGVANWLR